MSRPDRLKAWAARKRERAQGPSSPRMAAPCDPSRDQALRDRSYGLVEHRDGQACPRGSSVTVKQIAYLHAVAREATADVVARFPRELTLAQCHAALAYYHLHRDEVDAELARDREDNAPGVLAGAGRLPRLGLEELAGLSEG